VPSNGTYPPTRSRARCTSRADGSLAVHGADALPFTRATIAAKSGGAGEAEEDGRRVAEEEARSVAAAVAVFIFYTVLWS
jgi:hypothetical protein